MPMDPLLLEILACPQDKGPLYYFPDDEILYNPRLRCSYRVRDGVPVMLVDEAELVDEQEHERRMREASEKGLQLTFDPGSQ